MAYSTTAQVVAEFKTLNVGASSPVSTTDVERFIQEADALIDSYLSKRYATPITGTNALIMVRNISIMLVAQRIKDILRVKTGREESSQDGRGNLRDYAMKLLNDIVDRRVDLSDATVASTGQGVASYVSSNDVPFIFERGTEQW